MPEESCVASSGLNFSIYAAIHFLSLLIKTFVVIEPIDLLVNLKTADHALSRQLTTEIRDNWVSDPGQGTEC